MPPPQRQRGGRLAVLGSPRGLTNGGERPALRRAGRTAASRGDVELSLVGPFVAGLGMGAALFLIFGGPAQASFGGGARTALAVGALAAAAGALWFAWRARK